MSAHQPGILQPVLAAGCYLSFSVEQPQALRESLLRVAAQVDGEQAVLGLGLELLTALGRPVPGLHAFPDFSGHGVAVPSTPAALWCWLRGDDAGDLLLLARRLEQAAAPGLKLGHVIDTFVHHDGRDLTGYEDGTENPTGDDAVSAAFAQGQGPGLDGASFVAVQQWLHDFKAFDAMSPEQQDDSIGRRRSDNEELGDAPASAHVKRTAQESFDPEAFVLRRSMPWVSGMRGGLMFVAFGASLAAFEAQMRRMAGLEDGVNDALFGFSRPVTGGYFWCPPMAAGRPDLSAIGL
jgi:putative iron-dependent peroxidase